MEKKGRKYGQGTKERLGDFQEKTFSCDIRISYSAEIGKIDTEIKSTQQSWRWDFRLCSLSIVLIVEAVEPLPMSTPSSLAKVGSLRGPYCCQRCSTEWRSEGRRTAASLLI